MVVRVRLSQKDLRPLLAQSCIRLCVTTSLLHIAGGRRGRSTTKPRRLISKAKAGLCSRRLGLKVEAAECNARRNHKERPRHCKGLLRSERIPTGMAED